MPSFRFRSKEQDTIDQVRAKLEAARADVAKAEVKLHDLAHDVALSEDENAFRDAMRELRDARDRAEVLQHAMEVAEQREIDRLAKARAGLRDSQNRAINQHKSALVKHALAYQTATDNAVSAFSRMVRAGESIVKLLPPNDNSGFAAAVSVTELTKACLAYLGKYSPRPNFPSDDPINPPGAHYQAVPTDHGVGLRDLPPLADRLKVELARRYDHLVGNASAPPAPDASRPDAMVPQPAPAPPPVIRVDPSMLAVEGPDAVRDALIANELAELLAKRRDAVPVEPVAEPDPAVSPGVVDEPDEDPPAIAATGRSRPPSAAISALFSR